MLQKEIDQSTTFLAISEYFEVADSSAPQLNWNSGLWRDFTLKRSLFVIRRWVAMYFPVRRMHVRTSKIVPHALAHAPRFLSDRTRTRTRTFLHNFLYSSYFLVSKRLIYKKPDHCYACTLFCLRTSHLFLNIFSCFRTPYSVLKHPGMF